MARRPKHISIDVVGDSTHPDYKKHSAFLIEDLLRKHPRGPDCKLTRADYRDPDWHPHPSLEGHGDQSANCGYSDLLIYRWLCTMNNDGSEWDWKTAVRAHYGWNLGKASVTRRSRRLAARTEGAYRRVVRAGRPGLYEVSFGHGYRRNGNISVYAENCEMAKMSAKINFGAAYPHITDDEIYVSFTREGCPSELMGMNMDATRKLETTMQQHKENIEKLQKEIELCELRKMMIQTYSIAAVAE